MIKINVQYKLHGEIELSVPKDFKTSNDSLSQLLRDKLDRDLVSGIENIQNEIDGDAIELVSFVLPNQK